MYETLTEKSEIWEIAEIIKRYKMCFYSKEMQCHFQKSGKQNIENISPHFDGENFVWLKGTNSISI